MWKILFQPIKKYCGHCKSNSHNQANCRFLKKSGDTANAAKSSENPDGQTHIFFKIDDTIETVELDNEPCVVDVGDDNPPIVNVGDDNPPIHCDSVVSEADKSCVSVDVNCLHENSTAPKESVEGTIPDVVDNSCLHDDISAPKSGEHETLLDGVNDSEQLDGKYTIDDEKDTSEPYLVDTGATSHINNSEENFIDLIQNLNLKNILSN